MGVLLCLFLYLSDVRCIQRHYLWFEIDVKSHMKRVSEDARSKGVFHIGLVVWTFSSSVSWCCMASHNWVITPAKCYSKNKKVTLSNFFTPTPTKKKTQSRLLEWQQCKKKCGKKEKKWEWLNWNRSVMEGRWISVLSVESCHNSPQQLFWEQLGVAGNMSHTPPLLCTGLGRNPT